jgi:ATP-dependent HslUV protease ATP-binding subunit HslU
MLNKLKNSKINFKFSTQNRRWCQADAAHNDAQKQAVNAFSFENFAAKDMVKELDKWIVGQTDAKKAIAIAMRSRWRRNNLPSVQLQKEIIPKNILMIGSSGVGKTELARRMAKLTGAPFVKVEATQYTEVGFKGADVEQMIEDLMNVAYRLVVEKEKVKVAAIIEKIVEERLLSLLIGDTAQDAMNFREDMRRCLREKQLENITINHYDPPPTPRPHGKGGITLGGSGSIIEGKDFVLVNKGEQFDFNNLIKSIVNKSEFGRKGEDRDKTYTISDIRTFETAAEEMKQISGPKLMKQAIYEAENYGIIFIDEIDKIAKPSFWQNSMISTEGVQRDLLPIIEGTKVFVQKFGDIDTSKMLFIGSGAFLWSKPSNLIAELQGRLPIRVKLDSLSEEDLYRIMTVPEIPLTKQHKSLMLTEGVDLRFTDDALREIAKCTYDINKSHENIGARRLQTVFEKVLEEYSYNASKYKNTTVTIDKDHIEAALKQFTTPKQDMKKFIL